MKRGGRAVAIPAVVLLVGVLCAGVMVRAMVRGQGGSAPPRTVALGASPLAVGGDEQGGHTVILGAARYDPSMATVDVVDTPTGQLLHTTTGRWFPRALAVDGRHERAFVAGGDNVVRVFDARTGAVVSSTRVPTTVTTMVADAQSARVFLLGDTDVCMLDTRSGSLLRDIPLGLHTGGLALDAAAHSVIITGYSDARAAGAARVIDARNGRILRTITLEGSPSPGVVAVDARTGRAFIIDRTINTLSIIDPTRGRVLGSLDIGGSPRALVIDPRTARAFVAIDQVNGGRGGQVRVVDTASGSVGRVTRATRVDGMPMALVADVQSGRIFDITMTTSNQGSAGRLTVLDARDGHVVRATVLHLSPHAATVDEHAGRVVIVGDAIDNVGLAPAPQTWVPAWARRWLPFLGSAPSARKLSDLVGRVMTLDATH